MSDSYHYTQDRIYITKAINGWVVTLYSASGNSSDRRWVAQNQEEVVGLVDQILQGNV